MLEADGSAITENRFRRLRDSRANEIIPVRETPATSVMRGADVVTTQGCAVTSQTVAVLIYEQNSKHLRRCAR